MTDDELTRDLVATLDRALRDWADRHGRATDRFSTTHALIGQTNTIRWRLTHDRLRHEYLRAEVGAI